MEFSGRLVSFPMPDLLQWAANETRTGALVVRRSRREKWILFEDGWIVGCLSDHPAEFFGQYLILNDYLDASGLVEVLAYSKKHELRLGAALTLTGVLDDATVKEALSHHIQDTVADLFLWPHGVFFFRDEPPPSASLSPSPIDSMAVLLEGSRWVDERARIVSESLPHDNIVLGAGVAPPSDLPPIERKIVERVDGMVTLHEIQRQLRGSHFRVLEAAQRCLQGGWIQVIAIGEEPDVEGSREINLLDVLYEHAAEKRVVEWSSELALPIDLVETFYPVWVGDPTGLQSAPGIDGRFAAGLTGRSVLSSLFSGDSEERYDQYRWLIDQLKQHNVALLPMPIPTGSGDGEPAAEVVAPETMPEAVAEEGGAFEEPEEIEGGAISGIRRWWKRVTPGG